MSRGRARLDPEYLPLFATDSIISAALLGPDRVREWRQIAPLLEARGLPKVDQLMGGRYWPAVRAFFDHQNMALIAAAERRSPPMGRRTLRNGDERTGANMASRKAGLACESRRH